MSYPTVEQLRAHAAHARSMSDAYRLEGNTVKADQRNDDAEFYDGRAYLEEIRLARLNTRKEAA